MVNYEDLSTQIAGIAASDDPLRRDIMWASANTVVGVAKTSDGRIEIFLAGPALIAQSPILQDVIDYATWHRAAGAPTLTANRLQLPQAEHFERVAAFLCVEMLRNGADEDLQAAFTRTEPILELALERMRPANQALLGLIGELLVLASALESSHDSDTAALAHGWDGWRPSLRDFSWGATGVEVKTTTGPTSTHIVAGTHQVDTDTANGESRLYFVSIGARLTEPHQNSVTLPTLVDRILARLTSVGADTNSFLAHLREYGAASGFGYDHATMREEPAFSASFEITFVRAYDMGDENVAVLRSADVAQYQHISPGSLRFAVQLPVAVTGDLNPVVGLHQAIMAIRNIST